MTQPTLQEVFGAGATQTDTTITILKADLPFTATATNNGEQAFAAMVKKASQKLTAEGYGTNIDQSIAIEPGYEQISYRTINGTPTPYRRTPLTINFAKAEATTGINPDEY